MFISGGSWKQIERALSRKEQSRHRPGAVVITTGEDGAQVIDLENVFDLLYAHIANATAHHTPPGIYRESFGWQTTWNVAHNLGRLPMVTVWVDTTVGYGTQPYGTTAYGGEPGDVEVDMTNPAIEYVDDDNLTVTWSTLTAGTIICIAEGG